MKIRTDFVTNSSSSSFTCYLKIDLMSGESLSWNDDFYPPIDLSNFAVNASPKQLGECHCIDELVELLKKSVLWDKYNGVPVFYDDHQMIASLKDLPTIDCIKSIEVSGFETYQNDGEYNREYTYDLECGTYESVIWGGYRDSEGSGGELNFSDDSEARIGDRSDINYSVKLSICAKDQEYIYNYEGSHHRWMTQADKRLVVRYSPAELCKVESIDTLFTMIDKCFIEDGKELSVSTLFVPSLDSIISCDEISMISMEVSKEYAGNTDLISEYEHKVRGKRIYISTDKGNKNIVKDIQSSDNDRCSLDFFVDRSVVLLFDDSKTTNEKVRPGYFGEEEAKIYANNEIVAIPDEIGIIGVKALGELKAVKTLIISPNVRYVEKGAFLNLKKDVAIECLTPKSVLEVDNGMLIQKNGDKEVILYYSGLQNIVVLDEKVSLVAPGAFMGSAIEKVIIKGVSLCIGAFAFSGCRNLQFVIGSEKIKDIGNFAFSDCLSLKKFVTEEKCHIGHRAFENCTSLELSINSGVASTDLWGIRKLNLIVGSKQFDRLIHLGFPFAIGLCNTYREGRWRNVFQTKDLYKGEEIFCNGKVGVPVLEGGVYHVAVTGSETYEVEMNCSIPNVPVGKCTCPTKNKHKRCKHMAAAMYAIQASDNFSKDTSSPIDVTEYQSEIGRDTISLRELTYLCVLYNRDIWTLDFLERYISNENVQEFLQIMDDMVLSRKKYKERIISFYLNKFNARKPEETIISGKDISILPLEVREELDKKIQKIGKVHLVMTRGNEKRRILEALNVGDEVDLIREPANAYDMNAVKCMIWNQIVGYLPNPEVQKIAEIIDTYEVPMSAVITEKQVSSDNHIGSDVEVSIKLGMAKSIVKEERIENVGEVSELIIPNGTSVVKTGIYDKYRNLKSIVIPDTVIDIQDKAFSRMTEISQLVLSKNLEKLGKCVFYGCTALTGITLPDSLIEIGDECFKSCSSLRDIHTPANMKRIGKEAFGSCRQLKNVDLSASLITEIPGGLFMNCKELERVVLPASITVIGDEAFKNCEALTEIIYPKEMRLERISSSSLARSGYIHNDIPVYFANFLVSADEERLVVHEGVTHIADRAIGGKVKTIILPSSINKIEMPKWKSKMPMMCNFEEIVLEEGITSIGEKAFYDCKCIKRVIIPESVTEINGTAFLQKKKNGKETIETLMTHILLIGKKGSYAERYALQNGFEFRCK